MMPDDNLKPVFLVGVKNTGKSRLAPRVARTLDLPSVDTDDLVTDLYASEFGTDASVRTIYRLDGGTTFRRLEAEACREAARRSPAPIAATGGGICDNPDAVAVLREGLIVALEGDPELLFKRIISGGIPSFMAATTPEEAWTEFRALHRRRQTLYRELSDVLVDVTDRNEEEIAAEIIIRIEELSDGRK